MLVLSRKKNESIVINDNITIVVVDVRGDKVRLGVDAPAEVTVHRKEVYEAIARQESIHVPANQLETASSDKEAQPSKSAQPTETQPRTKPIAKKVIKKKV